MKCCELGLKTFGLVGDGWLCSASCGVFSVGLGCVSWVGVLVFSISFYFLGR